MLYFSQVMPVVIQKPNTIAKTRILTKQKTKQKIISDTKQKIDTIAKTRILTKQKTKQKTKIRAIEKVKTEAKQKLKTELIQEFKKTVTQLKVIKKIFNKQAVNTVLTKKLIIYRYSPDLFSLLFGIRTTNKKLIRKLLAKGRIFTGTERRPIIK